MMVQVGTLARLVAIGQRSDEKGGSSCVVEQFVKEDGETGADYRLLSRDDCGNIKTLDLLDFSCATQWRLISHSICRIPFRFAITHRCNHAAHRELSIGIIRLSTSLLFVIASNSNKVSHLAW